MKSWTISDEIQRDPELRQLVESNRDILDDVIGPFSKDLIEVRWSVSSGGDKRTLVLTLSDWSCPDGKHIAIDPNELNSETVARRKFRRVLGDLLEIRNFKEIKKLKELIGE